MEKLCVKTVREIISHVRSKRDLQNLRLVQHSFADITTEFLFHTINIEPSHRSLSLARALSNKHDFSRYVKEITVHTYIQGHSNWAENHPITVPPKEQTIHKTNWTPATPEDEEEEEEEEEGVKPYGLLNSPKYTRHLSEILQSFPYLDSIQTSHDKTTLELELFQQSLLNRTPLLPTTSEQDISTTFVTLINAAYVSGITFTSIAGAVLACEFDDLGFLYRAIKVFKSCKVVDLEILGRSLGAVRDGRFFDLLSPVVGLQVLKLTRTYCRGLVLDFLSAPVTKYLGGGSGGSGGGSGGEKHIWPCLRSLDVSGMDCYEKDYMEFSYRHRKTLRRVVLANPLICTSLVDLARFMKEGLELTELVFCAPFGIRDGYRRYSKEDLQTMVGFVTDRIEDLPQIGVFYETYVN